MRARLPRVYRLLWWGTLINRAGNFVVPLLTYYLTQARGLRLDHAGEIVALYGVGQIGASLVGGVLADHLGRRASILISMFGGAASMLALGLVRAPEAIAAMVLVTGFAGELYRPAVAAMIADVVPPEDRLRAYSLLYWAVNLGFSIAPLLAGVVSRWSYSILFVVDAATTATYGVIVLLRVPETKPARVAHHAPVRLATVLADRTFMVFVALAFLAAWVPYQSNVALAAYMGAQGHSSTVYGAVVAVNGVLIVLFQPSINRALATRDPSRVLAMSALVTGLGFFMHDLGASIALHVAAVSVWTLGEILGSGIGSTMVAAFAPTEARGRYQGVFVMSWGLASATGPLIGSRVLASWGPSALWSACLALGAVVALLFVVTAPARRARTSAIRS
ncbi:MAG TPA: MFS transporter [Kofleriaceae bacterium]|nr:MFS transporter [Kofleriaceae bacterium]